MLRRRLIIGAYWLARLAGLFALARWLTGKQLRVLCYHGFALEDENRFRGSLFVTREFFARRMRYLARRGYPVIRLDHAIKRIEHGALPPAAVAITIDDGFHSTHAVAREILADNGFPSLLYLTSYYFEKGTPVFQLTIDYIFWKTKRDRADLSGLGVPGLENAGDVALDQAGRCRLSELVHAYGASRLEEAERIALCRQIAARLGVDYDRIEQSRMFSLVSPDELRELEESGMRTGLHTHRHCFPTNPRAALAEIEDNRAAVEPVIERTMTDFCYPSGAWTPEHWATLELAGIKTAATCESGLVDAGSQLLALPRILDDSRVSMIEFEAEVSGFCEVLRGMRRKGHGHAVSASIACEVVASPLQNAWV